MIDSSEADSEPWTALSRANPQSIPVTRAICPFYHLADTDQANDCHLLTRGSCCSHFPSAWLHLQYCHAPVGAEPAPLRVGMSARGTQL